MPAEKTLKQRLRSGESLNTAGASLEMTKAQLTEILSKGAYDLVAVDAQHSAFSETPLAAFCGWAAELGVPVQLRIKGAYPVTDDEFMTYPTVHDGPSLLGTHGRVQP